jgi:hypothetical protein
MGRGGKDEIHAAVNGFAVPGMGPLLIGHGKLQVKRYPLPASPCPYRRFRVVRRGAAAKMKSTTPSTVSLCPGWVRC